MGAIINMKPSIYIPLILGLMVSPATGVILIYNFGGLQNELDCSKYERFTINELPMGCYDYYGIDMNMSSSIEFNK